MYQNPIDKLVDQIDLDARMLTMMVIKQIHPEWSMREVSESLEDPEKLKQLVAEVIALENESIDDLSGI